MSNITIFVYIDSPFIIVSINYDSDIITLPLIICIVLIIRTENQTILYEAYVIIAIYRISTLKYCCLGKIGY